MKQKKFNQQIVNIKQFGNYNCALDKVKFLQIGINDAFTNNNLSFFSQHLAQYQIDLKYIYDFLIGNEYSTMCKEFEIVTQQKKQLQVKVESLELQNLLRDEGPQQLVNQVQNLIEQNQTLKQKIQKLKKIAEQAQQQALQSLEISNLNQALFQQIQFDSTNIKQEQASHSNAGIENSYFQNQLDEKNQEIEVLKSQLEELALQQQQQYSEYCQEVNHQKMWINQLSNKLQLYEQQADSQRIIYEEKINELEQKLSVYETFDSNQTQELLQTLVD